MLCAIDSPAPSTNCAVLIMPINGSVVNATIVRSHCTIGQLVWGKQDRLEWANLHVLLLLQLSVCAGDGSELHEWLW